MNFLNKEKDNIISIVKSLRPINYLYSKQNKDYDKFFRSSSLKGLIKQINSRPRYNDLLKPGESLEEFHRNNKNANIMDVNFKSTFNYIEELSNLKNLPMVLLNKKLYKRGRFNSDYDDSSLTSKERKRRYDEKKKKEKSERISQIKNSGDAEVTLDPGRYHPNYNFIKRRYPCAYLGKPKPKDDDDDSFHKDLNEKEVKKKEDNNNSNNEEQSKNNIDNKNIKTRNNKKTYLENISNSSNSKNKNKKMNFSSPNFYSLPKSIDIKNDENKANKNKNEKKQNKEKSSGKIKDHNTVSSWSHTMDLDKSKKISENNKISYNDKSKTNYNYHSTQKIMNSTKYFLKNKKKLNKNSSSESLRCPIIFDKMPGRDRPINFVDGGWEGCRTNYNPDYNIIRPHVRSTIFKCKRKYQNFKKYITGKIIRSYCYSPDQYFVFEIKENKENDVSGKYGTIILKS